MRVSSTVLFRMVEPHLIINPSTEYARITPKSFARHAEILHYCGRP